MKYYHIIYNSSEKTQSGSVGLGVRTFTEGMPQEYIQLLQNNGIFSYNSGKLEQPNPKVLLENPNLMDNYPITYRFVKLADPITGKELYVIARTISVGFDYPYYIKYTAARVDNFVVDAYLFDAFPGMEALQIFYEDAKAGNVAFTPKTPVPSQSNEEMKQLSLGEMPLLKQEEKSFACNELPTINADITSKMLFAFLESLISKKPLIIKSDANDAARLMVDLMRVVPASLVEKMTFCTNYQLEGAQEAYNIFFVNEHYKFDYSYARQFVELDLSSDNVFETIEAKLYGGVIKSNIPNNLQEVHKYINWILSPVYLENRNVDPTIKSVLFSYLMEPNNFAFANMFPQNNDLWNILKNCFAGNKALQNRLNSCVDGVLKEYIQGNANADSIMKINALSDYGFDLSGVIAPSKSAISKQILSSVSTLVDSIKKLGGFKNISKYLEKSQCEEKHAYLDTPEISAYWMDMYDLFYSTKQKQADYIIPKMFELKRSDADIQKVMMNLNLPAGQTLDILLDVVNKGKGSIAQVWSFILPILNANLKDNKVSVDLAKKIKEKILSNPQINKADNEVKKWENITAYMLGDINEKNAAAVMSTAGEFATVDEFEPLLKKIIPNLKSDNYNALAELVKGKLAKHSEQSLFPLVGSAKAPYEFVESILNVYKISRGSFDSIIKKSSDIPEDIAAKIKSDYYGESFFKKIMNVLGKKGLFAILAVLVIGLGAGAYFFFFHNDKSASCCDVADSTKIEAVTSPDSTGNALKSQGDTLSSATPENNGEAAESDTLSKSAKNKKAGK